MNEKDSSLAADPGLAALLQEIRQVLEKITKGEWSVVDQTKGWHWPPDPRCRVESWRDYGEGRRGSIDIAAYIFRHNADLIAAAPRLLRACLARLEGIQETAWQSIETAPKDGTVVLLWHFGRDSGYIGKWFQGYDDRGWWTSDCIPVTPTLWCPLLSVPVLASSGTESEPT